jgi:hypothetical protein
VKKSGCAALGCSGALAALFAVLIVAAYFVVVGLFPHGSDGGPGPDPEAYQPAGSLNQFQRDEAGDRFRLSYGFIDYSGRTQRISCTVNREDYLRDIAAFGYFEKKVDQEINQLLRKRIEEEGRLRGVLPYFTIEVYGHGGYRWHWEAPEDLDRTTERRIQAFHDWLDQDFTEEAQEINRRYFEQRGLRLDGNKISIDYEQAVLRGTRSLESCFQALRRTGSGDGERKLLGLFLAFFQELRYELPPDVDKGRHTLGFRVPTDVMVRGGGDCDSKAAAFCALWRHFPRRVILILIPEHALVGVEGKPRADEAYVRLGNRYFVLCEVAGPAKIPPGGEAISGNFEYVMIEPVEPSSPG